MPLQPVSAKKLYIQIADQIRGLIERGEFRPGQQLAPERDLARELGVSRPTLREALIALEVAGLLEIRVGVGAFVRKTTDGPPRLPIDDHSPLEIMEARQVIEPHVAALAARSASREAVAAMEEILERMQAETAADRWSYETDRALHLAIAEECGNQTLKEIVVALWVVREEGTSGRFHEHLASIDALRRKILDDHVSIVAGIAAGDEYAARHAMASHIDYVHREMLAVWD